MATSLKLITWNTCGFKCEVKKKVILETLHKLQSSIAFLQETHIGVNDVKHVNNIPGWKSFFSVHHPRSKGVAILIRGDLPFDYINDDMDPTGSYIVLICKLFGRYFTLVNVYNHTKEHKLLQRLCEYLCQTAEGLLIVAGDFNTILNTDLDREYQTGHTEPLRPYLEEFISSLMLVDIWGSLHPYTCDSFTRFPWKPTGNRRLSKIKRTKRSASRLDMVLMPRNTVQLIESCEIYKCKIGSISDHHPVVLSLCLPKTVYSADQAACSSRTKMAVFEKRPFEWKAGAICEAEVLKALNSLIEYETTLGEKLENFKSNSKQKLKELKMLFNQMIRYGIHEGFTDSVEDNGWHIFKLEYVILATILARRVETFLQPSFKTKSIKISYKLFVVASFCEKPQKIKEKFLKKAFLTLKHIHPSPPRDFRIVENLLPSAHGYKLLRKGCPLTPTLLTMSLKHLASRLKDALTDSTVDVCHHRKCLTIFMQANQFLTLKNMIHEFRRESGISLLPKVGSVWRQKKNENSPKAIPVLSNDPGNTCVTASNEIKQELF